MTTYYWGRQIRLTVGDLVIEDLRMAFDIEVLSAPGSGSSSIRVWNLSPEHEKQITPAGNAVKLEAGYTGDMAVLYEGSVFRSSVKRTGLDRITTLLVASDDQSGASAALITDFWEGEVPAATIAGEIADAMGTNLVGEQFLAGITFEDYALSAPVGRAMTLVMARVSAEIGHPLAWRRDGVDLVIYRSGQSGLPLTRVLSQATGMVGSPERTDRGADVAMVLSDVPKLGDTVQLDSTVLSGEWVLIGINYVGDNWQGDFQARLTLGDLSEGGQ